MLKLDPEDADSDEEAREKSKLNSTIKTDTSANTSILNTTFQSQNESGTSGGDVTDNATPQKLTSALNNKIESYPDTMYSSIKVNKYTLAA